MTYKSDLLNESYEQNHWDMSTNSKTDFSQNYTMQSIAVRVQSIDTEVFFKNYPSAIDCNLGAIDCS